jgi:hypothetical protein
MTQDSRNSKCLLKQVDVRYKLYTERLLSTEDSLLKYVLCNDSSAPLEIGSDGLPKPKNDESLNEITERINFARHVVNRKRMYYTDNSLVNIVAMLTEGKHFEGSKLSIQNKPVVDMSLEIDVTPLQMWLKGHLSDDKVNQWLNDIISHSIDIQTKFRNGQ